MTHSLLANTLPEKPTWLRALSRGAIGVDRENKRIIGYVVAQEGPFLEPEPRGEFDEKSLRQIITLMKSNKLGTKSRLGHPTLSDDGIDKFTGRAHNPRLDSVTSPVDGQELQAVRADLHLSPTAFDGNPNGNLGEHILARAEEDPGSFASSLVLQVQEEWRLNTHGKRKTSEDGKELPPLWRPTRIHASDIVDQGAAASTFLSADIMDSLPDTLVRQACELLDKQFAGSDRQVIRSRLSAFIDRYLSYRFGIDTADEDDEEDESEDALRLRIWEAMQD